MRHSRSGLPRGWVLAMAGVAVASPLALAQGGYPPWTCYEPVGESWALAGHVLRRAAYGGTPELLHRMAVPTHPDHVSPADWIAQQCAMALVAPMWTMDNNQIDRLLQMGPCGQQDHRQVRLALANRMEQLNPFLAGGGVAAEVHVLDHQPNVVLVQRRQPGRRRGRVDDFGIVQREQY